MLRIIAVALILIFAALLFAVIIAVALLGGCRPTPAGIVEPGALPEETPTSEEATPTPQMTIVFTVDNDPIIVGATTTIRWDVQNAQRVFIDDVEVEEHQGAREVSPAETQTWTLRAERNGDSIIQPITVTVEQPPEPTPTPEPPPTPTPSGPACDIAYMVQPCDTLFSISRRYNTPLQALMACNPLMNPNYIMIGQIIMLPSGTGGVTPPPWCPNAYVVQPGDTLFSIAQKHGMPMQTLLAYNILPDPNYLWIGQVICIPAAQ